MGGLWGGSILQTADAALKDFGMSIAGLRGMINDMKMDVVRRGRWRARKQAHGLKGALLAIIFSHGRQQACTAALIEVSLHYAG
jgi:hypothetical protein